MSVFKELYKQFVQAKELSFFEILQLHAQTQLIESGFSDQKMVHEHLYKMLTSEFPFEEKMALLGIAFYALTTKSAFYSLEELSSLMIQEWNEMQQRHDILSANPIIQQTLPSTVDTSILSFFVKMILPSQFNPGGIYVIEWMLKKTSLTGFFQEIHRTQILHISEALKHDLRFARAFEVKPNIHPSAESLIRLELKTKAEYLLSPVDVYRAILISLFSDFSRQRRFVDSIPYLYNFLFLEPYQLFSRILLFLSQPTTLNKYLNEGLSIICCPERVILLPLFQKIIRLLQIDTHPYYHTTKVRSIDDILLDLSEQNQSYLHWIKQLIYAFDHDILIEMLLGSLDEPKKTPMKKLFRSFSIPCFHKKVTIHSSLHLLRSLNGLFQTTPLAPWMILRFDNGNICNFHPFPLLYLSPKKFEREIKEQLLLPAHKILEKTVHHEIVDHICYRMQIAAPKEALDYQSFRHYVLEKH
ncbi:MAG: hypothetical protein ACKVOH_01755, partial [Chlamydiales bacterium]